MLVQKKDLGVIIGELSFEEHLEEKMNKAYEVTDLIR